MRFFILILNGLGMGTLSSINSADFSSNAYLEINKRIGLKLPNLKSLGMNNINGIDLEAVKNPKGSFGKLALSKKSKGLLFDYLELFGYAQKNIKRNPLGGLIDKTLKDLEKKIGLSFICNRIYEGYKALEDFGEEHLKTGKPILYFSEDNTIQIASNLSITTKERLYEICDIVAKNLTLFDGVSKVVARPFYGTIGSFCRTLDRKDFFFMPNVKLRIQKFAKKNNVIFLNDFANIFKNLKYTHSIDEIGEDATKNQFLQVFDLNFDGIVFANLSNLLHLGKKHDYINYAVELERLDEYVGKVLKKMKDEDNLIIMGNHSSNPLNASFECGMEYSPILAFGKNIQPGRNLEVFEYGKLLEKVLKIYKDRNSILE